MILFPSHCWEIVLGKSLFSVCLSLDILIHFSKMLSLQGCYLYKDVIFTAESLERQRWNLPPERRTSLFPVKVLVAQSCPTLYNPMDSSPPGSSIDGILQARMLEWVATPVSRESSRPRGLTRISCIAGRFFTVHARTYVNWHFTRWFFCRGMGTFLCLVRCLATFLSFTRSHSPFSNNDHQKCLPTLPSVSWKAKLLPNGNHWFGEAHT